VPVKRRRYILKRYLYGVAISKFAIFWPLGQRINVSKRNRLLELLLTQQKSFLAFKILYLSSELVLLENKPDAMSHCCSIFPYNLRGK
jgi:hypothetical protein